MPNSGYVTYANLEQYYLDNGVATGYTKSNDISDPDYIAPAYDTAICPLPSASPSITPTPSVTPPVTPSITPSITTTPSITPTISVSHTPSKTPSVTPTVTPSITPSITATPSITRTPSITPTISVTPTKTPSVTPSTSGTLYKFVGKSTVDGTDKYAGCLNYYPNATYYTPGPVNIYLGTPDIGARLYTSYPSTPVNGGNKWVGLKAFPGAGYTTAYKIDNNGYILEEYLCIP
jgi:hypothetical protein